MPYIKQDRRDVLDSHIEELVIAIKGLNALERKGNCNYVFTKILNGVFPDNKYHEISEAMAALSDCRDEYYRRRMAPREDQAIQENGDVFGSPAPNTNNTEMWAVDLVDVDCQSGACHFTSVFNPKTHFTLHSDKLTIVDADGVVKPPKAGVEGTLTRFIDTDTYEFSYFC